MSFSKLLTPLRERPYFWFFGLLVPLLLQQLHYRLLAASQQLNHDARVTYLPLARRFLEDASGLFADPIHLMVAPGSFIYMAMLGADEQLIVQVNLLFSGLVLLLAFDALRRVSHGAAAVAVSWLIAVSALLPEIMIPALSEPPQIFCLSVWLWCCALICESPQRRWPVVLGGVALLLSILTRATYLYWIVAASGACLLLIWQGRPPLRRIASRLLIVHLIAGAGAASYVTYNKVVFDLPMVATGSGAAIYFGINPAVAGYEPPYYGLLHDHFQALEGIGEHLSIAGDRRLSQMAKAELVDMPPGVLAAMLLQKAGATLFFSQADLDRKVFNARAWHVVLVVLGAFGVWRYRRRPYVWMLGCILAYQVAIMTLVMHGTRYAIGAIELPLTFLAALGVGAIWHARSRARAAAACSAVVLLGVAIGYLHQRYSRPMMPDLSHVPHHAIAIARPGDLQWPGMDGDPFSAQGARITSQEAAIVWKELSFLEIGGMPIIQFHVQGLVPGCNRIEADYLPSDGQLRSTRLLLNGTQPEIINIGTLRLGGLDPQAGTLSIRMDCPVGTRLVLSDLQLLTVTRGQHYRLLIEERQAAEALVRE